MKLRAEQVRLQGLLKETITLLCKNGLQFKNGFVLDALIGITIDDKETFLVKLEETVSDVGDDEGTDGNEEGDVDDSRRRSSRASRKRRLDGKVQTSETKRQRDIPDDDSDNDYEDEITDEYDDDEDLEDIKDELEEGQLTHIKIERADMDDKDTPLQADGTAPDDEAADDGLDGDDSQDGSSMKWNESSNNDNDATGSQQVCIGISRQ